MGFMKRFFVVRMLLKVGVTEATAGAWAGSAWQQQTHLR